MSDIIPEGILYGNLGVGSGTTNYNDLDNKPQINAITLQGNKTASELGLVGTSDIPVTSVNGETGAVVLDGTEIEFSVGVSLNEKIIAVEQEIPVIAYPVTSVNGETGAVVLDGTDIEYSSGVSVNSQIDTLMNYIPVYGNTASGSIATFDTSLALPLQDCTIEINAVQESGTPTPSSPKAISGFTGANIYDKGVNLWDEVVEDGYITASGVDATYVNGIRSKNYMPCKPNTTYCYVAPSDLTGNTIAWYDINKTFIQRDALASTNTSPANAFYFRLSMYNYKGTYPSYANNVSLNYPATDTEYHAYNPNSKIIPITWQSEAGTVYGGSLDVTSGVLTVTHGFKTYTGASDENWSFEMAAGGTQKNFYIAVSDAKRPQTSQNSTMKCNLSPISNTSSAVQDTCFISNGRNFNFTWGNTLNISSTTDFKTWLGSNNIQVCYELETPVTYQLTPTQISAIVGTNNVFTDTNGDTSVVYACSLKDYIEGQ